MRAKSAGIRAAVVSAAFVATTTGASAQVNVVDSVRVTHHQSDYKYVDPPYSNCGSINWASWPDVAPAGASYSLVSTNPDDAWYRTGLNYFGQSNVNLGVIFPANRKAILVSSTGSQGGDFSPACQERYAPAHAKIGASFGEWHAVYSIPDGTPVAVFDWKTLGRTDAAGVSRRMNVFFDGSFANDYSHEAQQGGKHDVDEYLWNLGDGKTDTRPAFTHVYDEPGTYTVSLTVTDEEGETDVETRIVEVRPVILRVREHEDLGTVAEGDTILVYADVTNVGLEAATDVHIPRLFGFVEEYPNSENYGSSRVDAQKSAGILPTSDSVVVSLAPDATVRVQQKYAILNAAKVAIDGLVAAVPVDWELGYHGVTGLDQAGEAAEVVLECRGELSTCINEFRIFPHEISVTARHDGEVVTTMPVGLSIDPATDLPAFNIDGLPATYDCISGCVRLEIEATNIRGEPVSEVDVEVVLPVLDIESGPDGLAPVKHRPYGNVVCGWGPEPLYIKSCDNGSFYRHKTDENGRLVVGYYTPAPSHDTEVTATLYARLPSGGVSLDHGTELTFGPRLTHVRQFALSGIDTKYLQALALIASNPDEPPVSHAGFCNAASRFTSKTVDNAVTEFGGIAGTVNLSGTNAVLANWSQQLCEPLVDLVAFSLENFLRTRSSSTDELRDFLVAVGDRDMTAAMKDIDLNVSITDMREMAKIQMYLAFLDRAGIVNVKALAFVAEEVSIVTFPWIWRARGDHFDQTTDALIEALTASSHPPFISPDHPGFAAEVRLYEGSRLKASFGEFPVALQFIDQSLNHWLRLERTGGSGAYLLQKSEWASDQYRAESWISPYDNPIDWLFEKAESAADAVAGGTKMRIDEALFAVTGMKIGDFIQIGTEQVDEKLAELHQIIDVFGSSGKAAAEVEITLSAPLAYDYPAGTPVYRLGGGEVGPPAAPLPAPRLIEGGNPRLEWAPYPLSVTEHFDVEVATDTLFANVVWSVSDTVSASASPPPGLLDMDKLYLWRVRGSNSLGDGPWSVTMPVARTDSPTSTEDVDLPNDGDRGFSLSVPYPNPAAQTTRITYRLSEAGDYSLEVFDMLGRRARVVKTGAHAPGVHEATIDVAGLSAGVYLVQLRGAGAPVTQTLSVVR